MRRIFENKVFVIFLGFVLIASGSVLYTSVYNENLFSYIINASSIPFQDLLNSLYVHASEVLPKLENAKQMEEEINKLREEVHDLRELTADYYKLKKENKQYQKYLEIKHDRDELKFVIASAIGRDPSELFYGFTINRGTESGISEGDSVITENGFVGCVYRAEEGASGVTTILSPDIKLGASDNLSGDNGVITGNIKLCDEGLTSLTLIPAQNSIQVGDVITSTGLSGMYPKNLLIGRVKSVEYDSCNSSNYAIIEPFENIKRVCDVLVITGFKGKGEISQSVVQKGFADGVKS